MSEKFTSCIEEEFKNVEASVLERRRFSLLSPQGREGLPRIVRQRVEKFLKLWDGFEGQIPEDLLNDFKEKNYSD